LNKVKDEKYILYLYNLFKDFCKIESKYKIRKSKFIIGKIYYAIYFQIINLSCKNEINYLFYNTKSVKILPSNINDFLTAQILIY